MPTILGIFLFNSREISFDSCFAQLFFIHSLQCIESSVLLLMAFDRFVAICNPLRYASILTLQRIAKMGLDIMKMACSDITVNSIYGLSGSLLIMGLDSLLIFLSYVMILKTVLSITSQAERLRALNTCVAHLCIVLLFYTPEISLTLDTQIRE
ncbi:Olfactory receptor 51G2 [Chelonia mydas]|uniref:Olfactory receptor 51G2 n=1 Tax=Chelonia mydas TaxID=8469 RepID=M7B2H9_CHEMY|nr:Olfactory receptor 51G2 [Chelonia mydas]